MDIDQWPSANSAYNCIYKHSLIQGTKKNGFVKLKIHLPFIWLIESVFIIISDGMSSDKVGGNV